MDLSQLGNGSWRIKMNLNIRKIIFQKKTKKKDFYDPY